MSGNDFRLGSVLGFEIRIDFSWFVIFFLVFWSLSTGVFPQEYEDLSRGTHLLMGLAGTLLFFASLLTHELSHALVSRAKGIPIEGITLFVFGGMARTTREPDTPRDEMMIAGIGPVTSAALAGLFAGAAILAERLALGEAVVGVARYLAVINLALAIFNLMPGFPLDGGRVFRAIVWGITGNRTRATRLATAGGRTFGLFLIVIGAVQALGGAPLAGLWLVFIGWFLRSLAGASLRQHVLQDLLGGFVAADLMSVEPDVVPADLPVDVLVDEYFWRRRYGSYPVVVGDRPVGMVTINTLRRFPRASWAEATAADVMAPLSECAVVAPSTSIIDVMMTMGRSGDHRRALVIDGARLVGVISATDVARWVERVEGMEMIISEKPAT